LEAHPDHPGIAHYIIHTYDYPELAERGLPAAKLYAQLAPDSPHAKHMPSHIFSMLGMWDDLEVADESAAQAWYDYQQAELDGAVTSGELHSLDFLTYAYLQQAKDEKARQAVERRSSVTKFAPRRLGGDNAYAAIPMRYAIERGRWEEAAALEPVDSDFPVARAISHFGRALGAARSGHPEAAAADVGELRALQQTLEDKGDAYWAGQVEVQYGAATAWVMFAQGHTEDSLTFMRAAADLEDASKKHISMENRLIPMRELLGDMLLEAGNPTEALVEYETSLKNAPNRFRSYYGAAKAAQAAGDAGTATAYFQKLVSLAPGGEGARVEVVEEGGSGLEPGDRDASSSTAQGAFLELPKVSSCRSDSRMSFQIRAAVAPAIKPLAEATRLEIDAGLRTGDYACRLCSLAAISWLACRRRAPRASLAAVRRSPSRARRK
jgi:tetratricopeptide (TPR) repeat protein